MYVWTKKAEKRAEELGLEPRKAGNIAMCGYSPVTGLTAMAWLESGYIKHENENDWKGESK